MPSSKPIRCVHLQAEVGDVVGVDFPKVLRQVGRHALRELLGQFRLRFRQDSLGKERRELLLNLVREGEIEAPRLSGMQLAQDGHRLARVVVAIMIEENDLSADLLLQPARGLEFRVKKTARKYSARLLSETDHRRRHAS